jgi:hypothetical protein
LWYEDNLTNGPGAEIAANYRYEFLNCWMDLLGELQPKIHLYRTIGIWKEKNIAADSRYCICVVKN